MPALTAYGEVKGGKLILSNRKRFETDLSKFKDCAVELTIRKKNRRSNVANRYLWGVVYKEIEVRLNELGNDVNSEVVHEWCKGKFNPVPIIGIGGEMLDTKGGSTAEMNAFEFSEYIEKIIRFAAEYLEVCIPYPNTDLTLQF